LTAAAALIVRPTTFSIFVRSLSIVGKLSLGRETRPELDIGICGEHGGDPKTIAFCHRLGLDYVSCSPYRVPIARLAAAHAALTPE